jgi:hypothetical protein
MGKRINKSSTEQPGILVPRPKLIVETVVSQYDRVNGWLLASICVLGFLVLGMFLIWLTSGLKPKFSSITDLDRATTEIEGEEDDPDDPGIEDFPEEEMPQLANALEAIPDAISEVLGRTAEQSGTSAVMGRGVRGGTRGSLNVPEHKRWIIQYEADSVSTYARQLSYFKIDIGIFYKSIPNIVRLRDPGGSSQVIQSSREEEKKTLRFMHKEARMRRWDDELARRGGINLEPDGISCQFYPEETRQLLRRLEREELSKAGRELKGVRNTYFKLEAEGAGFAYRVVQIVYK